MNIELFPLEKEANMDISIRPETLSVIQARAGREDMTVEEWISDHLDEITSASRNDETIAHRIWSTIHNIDYRLDLLKEKLQPWTEMDIEHIQRNIADPAECFICLDMLQFDITLHMFTVVDRMDGTLKKDKGEKTT